MNKIFKGISCRWNRRLYKLTPVNAWKSAIIRGHFGSCPDCRALYEPSPELTHIGITADQVQVIPGMWDRIHRHISAEQSPVFHPRYLWYRLHPRYLWYRLFPRPSLRLVTAAAAMVLFLLLIPLTIPWRNKSPKPGNNRASIALENRDIVIHSLKVENRPAQAVVFQSDRQDRVIVWVK